MHSQFVIMLFVPCHSAIYMAVKIFCQKCTRVSIFSQLGKLGMLVMQMAKTVFRQMHSRIVSPFNLFC